MEKVINFDTDNRNSMNHVKELLKELTNIMSDANKAGADVLTGKRSHQLSNN